ncbi:FAD-dependent oxidoreductase [Streptomyces sp. NPDC055186]
MGWAASGRNGGFCATSLTHSLANGLARRSDEIHRLKRLGARNLDAVEETVARHAIDCDFERTGEIDVATEPHQERELRDRYQEMDRRGFGDGVQSTWTPTRPAPTPTRPPPGPGCGTAGAWPCSTRRNSPGG